MIKICRESEASLDYYSLFKAIMKRAPVPMSPLESLASSAVRTAHKVGGRGYICRVQFLSRMPYWAMQFQMVHRPEGAREREGGCRAYLQQILWGQLGDL